MQWCAFRHTVVDVTFAFDSKVDCILIYTSLVQVYAFELYSVRNLITSFGHSVHLTTNLFIFYRLIVIDLIFVDLCGLYIRIRVLT